MTLQPWLAIGCLAVNGGSAGWVSAVCFLHRRLRLPFSRRLVGLVAASAMCLVVGATASIWTLVTGWRG